MRMHPFLDGALSNGPCGGFVVCMFRLSFLVIATEPQDITWRNTADLCDALNLSDCVMRRRVPTVDGDKTLTVREGTQSGDRLRMRGYGVPTLAGRGRGDQYVHVKCVSRGQYTFRYRSCSDRPRKRNKKQSEIPENDIYGAGST